MAVAIDAVCTADAHTTAGTTLTNSNLTVGSGANRILLAGVLFGGALPTITAFQWDAAGTPQNLTLVPGTSFTSSTRSGAIYALVAPTAGNKQLKITWTGTNECSLGCASYTGASQAAIATACPNGVTSSGTSAAPNIVVTSATGDIVFGIFNDNNQVWTTTSGNTVWTETALVVENAAGAYVAGAASVTLTYNIAASDTWSSAGCDVAQVAAAANPFVAPDRSPPSSIRVSPYDLSQALNPNLFKNPIPFMVTDRRPAFRVPLALPQPPQSLNLNLFKNPIPFNQFDWSKPLRLPAAPFDKSVQINPNLFQNPIPFLNLATVPSPQRPTQPFAQPYNAGLYTIAVVQAPFNQTDWSVSRWMPPALVQSPNTLNPNLFTNPIPFLNIDQRGAHLLATAVLVAQPYNQSLYTVTVVALPFFQVDIFQVKRPAIAPLPDPPLNINLFTNPFPFTQTDWSKPFAAPRTTIAPPDALNINLFTNPIPFFQTDWTPAKRLPKGAPQDAPYNSPLYTITVVAAPFVQTDWRPSQRVKTTAVLSDLPNIPLLNYLSTPFYPTDQMVARGLPATKPDGTVQTNINLFTNPIPFSQFDWSKPWRAAQPLPPDQPQNFVLLNVVVQAIPFNQFDWSVPRRPASPTQAPLSPNPLLPTGVTASLGGLTIDAVGNTIPFCTVDLFRTSDNAFIASTTSDAGGNYLFTGLPLNAANYFVNGYLVGTPDIFGTTSNKLTVH